jgi:tetratricopeptide (TPR) repeat protein
LSYFKIGDSSSAALAYQKGLQVNESAELFAGLAMVYRSQKNWQAECAALKNQSRLNPGDAYVHYRLGMLLAVLDPAHSLTELQAASELNPNADSAVKTVRAALYVSATQADPSQQMLTIGRGLGLVKEWDLAIAAFEKATVSDPKNADAWAWLGEAKQQLDQDGSKELDTALTLNPSSVIVHALRGLYWNRKSNYPKMLAEYTQAASIDPVNPAWQAEIGNAFANKGDLAAAFDAYQHAIELAPKDSTYWRLLAVFCAENNIHLEDAGLPAAKKAVELSPKDPNSLDALGWLYLATGRYANAEQVLKDTVTRFPDHLPAHIHLAMTYLAQGNRKDAFSELTFVHDADTLGGDGEAAGKLLARYFP